MSIEQPIELKVNELFFNDFYSIPIYQRSYAWGKDQIEQLITDIYDATDKDKYFLGSLIVDNTSKHNYSVIDGQQRLTTLYLLMSYLKNSLLRKDCLTFEAREESNTVLKKLLEVDFSDDSKDFEGDDSYNDEITSGVKLIQEFFRSHTNYKQAVINNLPKVVIIRTQVPKNIDLNHYFEIMNTRGEQLELHEIAKGRILEKICKEEQPIAAKIWDACSQMNEYIQMCLAKDVRSKIFGDDWSDFKITNFDGLVNIYKTVEKDKGKSEKVEETGEDLMSYYSLNKILTDKAFKTSKEKKDDVENERFESIINFPNFLMIVNEANNISENEDDSGLDDKKFIEKLEHIWDNKDNNACQKCRNFIFNMLKMKFLFDKYIIKREYAKDYKTEGKWSLERLEKTTGDKPKYVSSFSGLEEENRAAKNLRTLQSALRITYTSPKTMHWISKVLNKLNITDLKYINAEIVTQTLEYYSCKKIKEAEYKTKKGFEIERIVFTYLDYILFRDYSDKAVRIGDNNFKYSEFQFQFRTSIEHFYPQHPIKSDNIEDWNTEEYRQKYLNNFGNLVLITVKANSKFSNLLPNSKIDSYSETLKQSLKFLEMESLRQQCANWTMDCVLQHEQEMMKLLDNEIEQKGKIKIIK